MARRSKPTSRGPKYAAERQELILQWARRDGRVESALVAESLGVTTETVRRDLLALEREGILERVHGGALLAERRHIAPDVSIRIMTRANEKLAIAQAALSQLPDEGSVIIDAGSTTLRLAELFPDDRALTVVTNSIQVAAVLLRKPQLTVFTVGGQLNSSTQAEGGSWALAALRTVNADVAFLGTYGFTPSRGCSATNQAEATVKRAMVESSDRLVVLADHTKLGVNHFSTFADADDVDLLITDGGVDAATVHDLEQSGQNVLIAPLSGSPLQQQSDERAVSK